MHGKRLPQSQLLHADPYLSGSEHHHRQGSQDSGVVATPNYPEFPAIDDMDTGVHMNQFGHQQFQQPWNGNVINNLPGTNVDTGVTRMDPEAPSDLQPSIDPNFPPPDLNQYTELYKV